MGGGNLKIALDEMHIVLACRLELQLEGNSLLINFNQQCDIL